MIRFKSALALAMVIHSVPTHADRIVCQKWVTVGRAEDGTEYLVDVWSIVDRGPVKTYHYEEDRSKSAKTDQNGFKVTGMSTYHAIDCGKMVYADIDVQDADLRNAPWKDIGGDAIASREAEVVCSANLRDRPPGVSSE